MWAPIQKHCWKRFLMFLLVSGFTVNGLSLFRMTKVNCESQDKALVRINHCRLRAIRRGVSVFNMNVTIIDPAYSITVMQSLWKRENGYKPFLFNVTFDACEYLKKRNHPSHNLIYGLFKDFSNMNHTCPFGGDQILNGFYLRREGLRGLPMPEGDYLMSFRYKFNRYDALLIKVYFEIY